MQKLRSLKNALFLLIILIAVSFPFVFFSKKSHASVTLPAEKNISVTMVKKAEISYAESVYSSAGLNEAGLSFEAFNYAIKGRDHLVNKKGLAKQNIITVVDFTKPSTEKRLYVVDLENEKILYHTYVAHGRNTGLKSADKFSNKAESLQSSLGFFETLGTYNGKHGYSLKLSGVENGINDNAESRAIVIHSAAYVSEGFIKSQGYLGRSWGCPALPVALNKPIIDLIKNGSCLFIYSSNKDYFKQSRIINS